MTDTSTEAVERLAEAHDRLAEKGSVGLYPAWHRQRATTLGALRAERDALRAEVANILAENDALRFTLNNANAALRQAVERARGEALEEAARVVDTAYDTILFGFSLHKFLDNIALAIRTLAETPDA
jgi:hypothetical protein